MNQKKVAIMQPYLLPYLGYFQLISSVDIFVIYDSIQYTKKGWFNRNNFLMNASSKQFTIPIKKDSDYLNVSERELAENANNENKKILNQIYSSYRKAPHFLAVYEMLERVLNFKEKNLFHFLKNSIDEVVDYIGIDTKVVVSSKIESDHSLKAQERVIGICKDLKANHYINPEGGVSLYDKKVFETEKIELSFLCMNSITYPQFNHDFVGKMSILDVLMFNDLEKTRMLLNEFKLIKN